MRLDADEARLWPLPGGEQCEEPDVRAEIQHEIRSERHGVQLIHAFDEDFLGDPQVRDVRTGNSQMNGVAVLRVLKLKAMLANPALDRRQRRSSESFRCGH